MAKRKSSKALRLSPAAGPPNGHLVGPQPGPAMLLEFRHGLGDLVQLSIVLAHVARFMPHVALDVVCDANKALGKTRFERQRFGFQDERYNRGYYSRVMSLDFDECTDDAAGLPSTKPYRCLTQVMRLDPSPELFSYQQDVSAEGVGRARQYLAEISGVEVAAPERFPVVLIHYQGFSSRMAKDLPHEVVSLLCREIRSRGRAVAIFDIDRQSPVVDFQTVFAPVRGHPVWQNPNYADPDTMLAMIDAAELVVGIDSGPLHLAGCSSTPAIGVWTHHHPTRFFDFASNVNHLVPVMHRRFAPGQRSLETFEQRYRHIVYSDLTAALLEQVNAHLVAPVKAGEPASTALRGLTATGYDEQYYTEHLLAGLDYLGHGEWQRRYGRWLARVLSWSGQQVCDVGCACGSILRGLGEAGIVVQGFDVSEYLIDRGRQKWPDMAPLMHVMDATNCHLFPDQTWDGLHSAQVAEHWKPELVPFILRELLRIIRPGGLFACFLDTTEVFERHGRTLDKEDPTHICVKSMDWWHEQLTAAGWDIATAEFAKILADDAETFFKEYDWGYFIARRPVPCQVPTATPHLTAAAR